MAAILSTYGPAFVHGLWFIGAVFVAGLFVASLVLKDVSLVDVFWGLGNAAMAWIFFASGRGDGARAVVTLVLATAWGVRLGGYIGLRNFGAEDARYARLRRHIEERGGNFALHSLRTIFLFQGLCMAVCSLPLLVAIVTPGRPALGVLGIAGAGLAALGIVIETVADFQMSRFRRTRTTRGEVMDRGLWRYSRHPNYFGEMLVQWSFFLLALDAGPIGFLAAPGPLILSYLIMGPMGANLLERRLGKKNPGYEDYVRRTSAFIPLPPKPAAADPFGADL